MKKNNSLLQVALYTIGGYILYSLLLSESDIAKNNIPEPEKIKDHPGPVRHTDNILETPVPVSPVKYEPGRIREAILDIAKDVHKKIDISIPTEKNNHLTKPAHKNFDIVEQNKLPEKQQPQQEDVFHREFVVPIRRPEKPTYY